MGTRLASRELSESRPFRTMKDGNTIGEFPWEIGLTEEDRWAG